MSTSRRTELSMRKT